ncbi:MAG: hypothetical protein LBL69_04930, partial [Zoogloeaceae bacterium]|nr:hypothetical protein [Zoogloeaceae bacterium]
MSKMRLLKWIAKYKIIIAARELKSSTVAEKSRAADFLGEAIGNKKLKKIRPAQIALACRSVWDPGQHAKARRILVTARDLFGEAVANGYLPINPALHVRPLSNRVKRARLSIRQWRRVQKHLAKSPTPWKRHLALLALITGQRRGDLAKMQFSDVWK